MAAIDRILEWFERISAIPRCSKNEEAIARWFEAWAQGRGWASRRDATGNLVIEVPASPGCERAPGVVVQGHLDMVCERTPESTHDFAADPIRLIREGDWLRADDTTLGADNGVALAVGAALAEAPEVTRPPLELLFTVDEETGLTGAKQLQPKFVKGRTLINLDSETEGVFTVGCAGGRDVQMQRPFETVPPAAGVRLLQLTVGGLHGGHSGVDIHRPRANAIRLLALALDRLTLLPGAGLATLSGGTRRNAIPRDASALLALPPAALPEAERLVGKLERRFAAEYPLETALRLGLSPHAGPPPAELMRPADAETAVRLLLVVPHGPAGMSPEFPDVVMTSNNLAMAGVEGRTLTVFTTQRSLSPVGLDTMSARVRAVAALAGAQHRTESEYPAWVPNLHSPLLGRCREVYRRMNGREAQVRAIHAGLECALIGDLYPGMDMISLGPTTEDAHSPSERLNVPSLARLWDFTVALLRSLAAD
jgi:dipeptidase D